MSSRKGLGGKGIGFIVMLVVLGFAIVSGAIAWSTVDDCENRGYDGQHWNFLPPEWDCEL